MITRPEPGEYSQYYHGYIQSVEGGDILKILKQQPAELNDILNGLSEKQCETGYAPGKWSIKELLCHIIDSERVFAYRALRFARKDRTPLPGFEQDDYVKFSGANDRGIASLINEFEHLRLANVELFSSFNNITIHRTGEANHNEVSIRALVWITAGHSAHHFRILREKYLKEYEL
ncbi:MAG: DinB family protein [Ignavibacteriaceae bacterium]|nr:DinB family protein [Ignavibacteriaceae bacterium]